MKTDITKIKFHTPPFNQGQPVEVSYGIDKRAVDAGRTDYILERTDYPDDEPTTIRRFEDPDYEDEDSSNLDFWNGVPELGDETEEWTI